MPQLQRLRAEHAAAVLAFETVNRAYFASFISDRGDGFFEDFNQRFDALLADQDAGNGAYYVLLDEGGSVLGRFNLVRTEPGVATLGYRVAERVAGRGVATANVRDLCQVAARRHGLLRLRAATSLANLASQRVLAGAGFTIAGPADPSDVGGRPGIWYERPLTDPGARGYRPGSPEG